MNDLSMRAADDRGDTLIEILITVVIMGIAFAAILGGFATSVKASGVHEDLADAQAGVRNAAEQVKAKAYVPCAGVGATSNYSVSVGGVHVDVGTPEVWVNSTSSFVTATSLNCPTAQLQRISVTACRASAAGSGACPSTLSQTLVVTKRAP